MKLNKIMSTKNVACQILSSLLLIVFAELKAADTTRVEVGPGVHQIRIIDRELPRHIVALEIDISRPENRIEMALANDRLDSGFETVDNIARRKQSDNRVVIGAVNADYFGISDPMNPYTFLRNSMVMDGQLVFTGFRDIAHFGILDDGSPFIGSVEFEGWLRTDDGSKLAISGVNNERTAESPVVLFNSWFGDRTTSISDGMKWRLIPDREPVLNEPVTYTVESVSEAEELDLTNGHVVLSVDESVTGVLSGSLQPGNQVEIFTGLHALYPSRTDANGPDYLPGEDNRRFKQLTGGGPHLLLNGEHVTDDFLEFQGFSERHSGMRHNRSAVGFNKDTTRIILAAIDGRQPKFSVGATPAETADIMRDLGAWNAVNLDGGGSTTLIVRERMANRHDDKGTMRPVANALVVTSELNIPEITSCLRIFPPGEMHIRHGETVIFNTRLIDRWGYELPVLPDEQKWDVASEISRIDRNGALIFTGDAEGMHDIISRFHEWADTVRVHVAPN